MSTAGTQQAATLKLSARERLALQALVQVSPDYSLNFRGIAERSGLDPAHVRRTVRALARKGCALYQRGLFTEDGETAGAGYMATDAGRAVIAAEENTR